MLSVRNGLVVVGCVFVGFVTSAGPGLVARAAEPPRWGELGLAPGDSTAVSGPTTTEGGEAQRRIAQLEQRLNELEAERRATTADGSARAKASGELQAALAQNRELGAQPHAGRREPGAGAEPPVRDAGQRHGLRTAAGRRRSQGAASLLGRATARRRYRLARPADNQADGSRPRAAAARARARPAQSLARAVTAARSGQPAMRNFGFLRTTSALRNAAKLTHTR
jgi:hypothetical protein